MAGCPRRVDATRPAGGTVGNPPRRRHGARGKARAPGVDRHRRHGQEQERPRRARAPSRTGPRNTARRKTDRNGKTPAEDRDGGRRHRPQHRRRGAGDGRDDSRDRRSSAGSPLDDADTPGQARAGIAAGSSARRLRHDPRVTGPHDEGEPDRRLRAPHDRRTEPDRKHVARAPRHPARTCRCSDRQQRGR